LRPYNIKLIGFLLAITVLPFINNKKMIAKSMGLLNPTLSVYYHVVRKFEVLNNKIINGICLLKTHILYIIFSAN